MRANAEAARDAGVSLMFLDPTPSTGGFGTRTTGETVVCYKERASAPSTRAGSSRRHAPLPGSRRRATGTTTHRGDVQHLDLRAELPDACHQHRTRGPSSGPVSGRRRDARPGGVRDGPGVRRAGRRQKCLILAESPIVGRGCASRTCRTRPCISTGPRGSSAAGTNSWSWALDDLVLEFSARAFRMTWRMSRLQRITRNLLGAMLAPRALGRIWPQARRPSSSAVRGSNRAPIRRSTVGRTTVMRAWR